MVKYENLLRIVTMLKGRVADAAKVMGWLAEQVQELLMGRVRLV
jgi:hypothetical protein